jgi:RNA polymerase sigma factor (TIGR02999 family)
VNVVLEIDRRRFFGVRCISMSSDVSRILLAVERGDSSAASQLLPLVYKELRRLAGQRLAREPAGLTLDATSLVHEAYIRLVDQDQQPRWENRGHFFAAAAEAMRRILVESARRRHSQKRGGEFERVELHDQAAVVPSAADDVLALNEALDRFAAVDARAAALVKLRYFGGLTLRDASECLGIAPRTADALWAYSRAWLFDAMK